MSEKICVSSGMLVEPLISHIEWQNKRAGLSQRCLIYEGPEGEALARQHLPVLLERVYALDGVGEGVYLVKTNDQATTIIAFDSVLTNVDMAISLANNALEKHDIERIPELPRIVY